MTAHPFGQLDDEELHAVIARLEATVAGLQFAQLETGQRIRDRYAAHLDAARVELAKRKA